MINPITLERPLLHDRFLSSFLNNLIILEHPPLLLLEKLNNADIVALGVLAFYDAAEAFAVLG